MNGRLIVFEGTDGSGKATQSRLLCEHLQRENIPYKNITFPQYGKPSAAMVQEYLDGNLCRRPGDVNAYAASLMFSMDRYASYKQDWGAFYEAGGLVIADRYTTSNAVHQGSKLEGAAQAEFFTWLYDLEYDKMGLPKPDLVLCLDMPTELAHLLREKRDTQGVGDRDIHEHAERYLARCRETARLAAKYYGWTLISCVKDGQLRSIEDIHEEIYRHIAACLED